MGDVDTITVELSDGRVFEKARLIGTDPESEIALIKIDATGLPVLPMGDSAQSRVGDRVVAVGNPFGLTQTLTAGVISAKGRSNVHIAEYEDFIQTDAAINPGNSGGPLINLDGEAVGINTAIYSQSGGYMGIGFAIPINMVKAIEKQLKEHGQVIRGYLGVMIQDLTADLAQVFGIKVPAGVLIAGEGASLGIQVQAVTAQIAQQLGVEEGEGVVIVTVQPGSAAETSGLRPGDVVVQAQRKSVNTPDQFQQAVREAGKAGQILLLIKRGEYTNLKYLQC